LVEDQLLLSVKNNSQVQPAKLICHCGWLLICSSRFLISKATDIRIEKKIMDNKNYQSNSCKDLVTTRLNLNSDTPTQKIVILDTIVIKKSLLCLLLES
jgi:hypothetical protein